MFSGKLLEGWYDRNTAGVSSFCRLEIFEMLPVPDEAILLSETNVPKTLANAFTLFHRKLVAKAISNVLRVGEAMFVSVAACVFH